VGKIAKKTVWRCAFFDNLALKIQCHVVKNTLLQTAFSAIFPTEYELVNKVNDGFTKPNKKIKN